MDWTIINYYFLLFFICCFLFCIAINSIWLIPLIDILVFVVSNILVDEFKVTEKILYTQNCQHLQRRRTRTCDPFILNPIIIRFSNQNQSKVNGWVSYKEPKQINNSLKLGHSTTLIQLSWQLSYRASHRVSTELPRSNTLFYYPV